MTTFNQIADRILRESGLSYPADPGVLACTGLLAATPLQGATTCVVPLNKLAPRVGYRALLIYDPTLSMERQDNEQVFAVCAWALHRTKLPLTTELLSALAVLLVSRVHPPVERGDAPWLRALTPQLARLA